MADIVIGLDIDSSAARAVEIAPGNPARVRRMGQVSLPAGAVRDGEVVDAAAVGSALRRLWTDAGFSGRSVRVAIASARVIVRPVGMPPMSDGDTRSALRFQLTDFVPMAPEQTVFDFQQLEVDPAQPDERQVLLAAAPLEVVEPLVDALRQAGLRAAHVDTAAVALARLGASSSPAIDAVVSVGADMVVVVATRSGQPIFARALSNLGDRHGEIVDEIGDSLAYFAVQSGGGPAQTVTITGSGDLAGIRGRLEERLVVPVGIVDPFAHLALADGIVRSDQLVPSLGLALGTALGAERGRGRSINLLTDRAPGPRRALRPLLFGAAAVLVVLGGGSLARDQQQAISAARDERDQIEAQLTTAREQAAERAASGTIGAAASAGEAVVAVARAGDVDWTAVAAQLDAIGEPIGVGITSLKGASSAATSTSPAAPPDAGATFGSVSISGTAADLYVVAAWIDAVVADDRFDAAWVNGSNTSAAGVDLEFTAVLTLNASDLMAREQLTGAQS